MALPLFSFDQVVVAFQESVALTGVTVDIEPVGITMLVGPSGAGKSTLLRLCNRLEVPTSGVVRFRGDDVSGLDPLALRRRVGMVFQRPALFPGSVRDNLLVAKPSAPEAEMAEALERAGLSTDFLDRRADDLSGGEAQRASLARTLVTGPEVLLMDEPTSALDPSATRLLEVLARRLADDGVPLLWVTHDLAQAARIGDRSVVLIDGRVAEPVAAERFLGDTGQSSGEGLPPTPGLPPPDRSEPIDPTGPNTPEGAS